MRLKPSSYLILGMPDSGVTTGYADDRSRRFFWAVVFREIQRRSRRSGVPIIKHELQSLDRGRRVGRGGRHYEIEFLDDAGRTVFVEPVPRAALRPT